MPTRIGNGYDVHQLEAGTPLIIGGVSIPYPKGSKGHSDGDVLFHAIVDALLGSLALGDIGKHFPSNDPSWKNADSRKFLAHAFTLIKEKGYSIENVDSVIILQKPALASYILEMRNNIAKILSTELNQISIKATTTDNLGFIGKGEGIAATAVVLISNGS
ncbi:MAG: 2-C-methyl-D-erythritol 2,4-cyclodiphosphate synthase [Candidatus Marinimicrobia bacterium]|nr:2-C-methyl-D-erythritol 2,4-cyclodiphosphate synthase [Candidatus Neomarinimicrobiota bacterium]